MNFLRNTPKDKLQKIVLVGIGTLGVVVGTMQFYVLGQWHSLFGSREEMERLKTQIADVQDRERAAKDHEPVVKQLHQFVDVQQAAMAQGNDAFAWAVRELSLMVEQHAVHLVSLRPGGSSKPTSGKEAPATYNTRLEVTGAYDQIGTFVKDIENRFPSAEIRSLEISGNASAPGTHQANIDLAFRVRAEPPSVKPSKKVTS